MSLTPEQAYEVYLRRFTARFGAKPDGAFVKFDTAMVQKLSRKDFEPRLEKFLKLRKFCERMLKSESTISDSVTLEFRDACAWLAIPSPDLLAMFSGELGSADDE